MALLEIKRLSVVLPVGGSMRPIIEDLSFEIEQGQSVGLVGESGSGKSVISSERMSSSAEPNFTMGLNGITVSTLH